MTVGDRIRNKRIELGLTQEEVSEKLGYKSRSSVNKMENSRALPLPKVERMAEVLGCSPAYLMGWENENEGGDEKRIADEMSLVLSDGDLQELIKIRNRMNESTKKRLLRYANFLLSEQEES